MGKFDGWLIATDLDGTLINRDGAIPQRNLDAIRTFQDEGGLFTIATGRSLAMCHGYLAQLKINTPAVLINGSLLYDTVNNQAVWHSGVNREAATWVLDQVVRLFPDICAQIHCDGPIAIVSPYSCIDIFLETEDLPRVMTTPDQISEPWYKIMFYADPARLLELENHVRQAFPLSVTEQFNILYSAPYYYEMMPAATNKGTGLLHLAEIMGIEHQKTIAIGDYFNDADMIRMAGIGAAVANAPEEIRCMADIVVGDHNEGAIADLIVYLETVLLPEE